jgi:phenylpropionate dioxygenase-like ring-hydroxylating dioxygenase large terminal subunit
MFVHQERLEHRLRPEHYRAPEHYHKEIERLFLPTWRLAGCRADLPRDGDFRTLEICGYPILLRNFSGEIHAFLNVCAHRHCRLTGEACGNSPTLKCQYHGWEYDASGHTRKIPDARCFRPWDRENAHLQKFRTAICGELVFLSLAEEGPSLRDYLGRFHEEIELHFSGPWRRIHSYGYEVAANWKTLVENTLESYHLPEVHGASFANIYPSEEGQTHELNESFTALWFDMTEAPRINDHQRRLVRFLGGKPTDLYIHRHFHPGLVVITSDLNAFAVDYLPRGPDRTEVRHFIYAFHGHRRGPLAALARWGLNWFSRRSYCRLAQEDAAIACEQQKGIEHSPFPGVIGTREERLYVFQEYVLDSTPDNTAHTTTRNFAPSGQTASSLSSEARRILGTREATHS